MSAKQLDLSKLTVTPPVGTDYSTNMNVYLFMETYMTMGGDMVYTATAKDSDRSTVWSEPWTADTPYVTYPVHPGEWLGQEQADIGHPDITAYLEVLPIGGVV